VASERSQDAPGAILLRFDEPGDDPGGGKLEASLTAFYTGVLHTALRDHPLYEGVLATPGRAARALIEMTAGYDVDIPGLFTTFERDGYDEMIVVRDIPFVSLCEHHMLPFTGRAHVGYIPGERIVGLSKLARVVDAYARRFQVQERLTAQVADALDEHLKPVGSIVVIEAEHSCMSCRGVRVSGTSAVTSSMRGALRDKPEARAEALALLRPGG